MDNNNTTGGRRGHLHVVNNNSIQMFFIILLPFFVACGKNSSSPVPQPPQAKLAINDVSRPEGNAETTFFEFRISVDKPSTKAITVNYNTADGTAKGGEDYTAQANTAITLNPGETEKIISVTVTGDDAKEGDEVFTVNLITATNAVLQKAIGIGTIINDDTKISFADSGFDAPISYPGYSLVWSDEFNGTELNTTDWSHQNGDGCPGNCGWGNNELEFYTNRAENLFFQDGKLIIEAKKESFGGKGYTSSKIVTAGKKAVKFGRVDIRALLPKGKGIWPALWMMPQDSKYGGWPTSGEIDIMELVGHEANKTYGTVHFGQPAPNNSQKGGNYTLPNSTFNDAFHVFSIEWKQDQIKWLVDDKVFFTLNKADLGSATYPFNEDFYFIINLAVGGNWPGNPDATTNFPQWLIVDYIRLYQ